MRDIACVMITCDRSPQRNYLRSTLARIRDSSGTMVPLRVYHDMQCRGFVDRATSNDVPRGDRFPLPHVGVVEGGFSCANQLVTYALSDWSSREPDPDFILFLEDDIDVCADFADSVGAWLDDHAREDRRIYSFGANYPQVQQRYEQGAYSWDYPIEKFYGTQAFAIRPDDALSLAEYIRSHCYDRSEDGTKWDLLMQDWSREAYPGIDHFLASCPAFVDHVGEESVVMPGRKGHTYPSWQGREWSYLKERQR